MSFTFSRADFPDDFLFGAATAAYQIEGTAKGGCGPSHWDTFAATPGNVHLAQDGAIACDHYDRWAEDLDLIKAANLDAYRFSTSWSRVMPDGRTVNFEGLDFYDRLVDGMLDRDLQPFLTLYHWDLPSALADQGGWMNRDVADRFADYARVVHGRIGDRVARTATINEPWCVSFLSHFLGHHAPGLKDIRATARAMHHVLLAHGTAVQALRSDGAKELGIVINFEHTIPASDAPEDVAAAERSDAVFNRWFVEGVTKGTYPDTALDGLGPHMPDGWEDDMATISTPMDWLGVNYYTRNRHRHVDGAPWPAVELAPPELETTDLDWEIYPDGLRHLLVRLHTEYTGDLPLYVTENGMAGSNEEDASDGVNDTQRLSYYDRHIAACREAIEQGAPLKGYFAWSLLDNYEWSFGYSKRFGLVHVDYESQTRTPKASYRAFQQALATNR